ncbi:hypothetical protein CC117_20235 [Parafrankia colletiae]|uniref:Uncharacterized protein n=1 Tax=Parafrankia colletiae TaxID=573497 RepID=A0A1S1QN31_9ACTN|nr:hypothetical protein [Parafrankia colletiae]MCK9903958.1 hypothetical protein [Frankia sp. Cpl3]OHV35107.1 hypothetical protein CC117_20235 [Parafrankia colletiae]
MNGPTEPGPAREVVGSLAQEAALLAAAVQEWMAAAKGTPGADADADDADTDTGPDADEGAGGTAGPAGSGHEGPCCACPVCRVLTGLRGEHAEVTGHLIDAAVSLGAAARAAWGVWTADARRRAAAAPTASGEPGAGAPAPDAAGAAIPAPAPGSGASDGETTAGPEQIPVEPRKQGKQGKSGERPATSAGSPRPRVQKIDVR